MYAEILKLENEIIEIKRNFIREKNGHIVKLQELLDKRINETPTGDLRNEFTDINILFNEIVRNL